MASHEAGRAAAVASSIQLVIIQPTPFCNLDCRYCYLENRTDTRCLSFSTLALILQRVFESPLLGGDLTMVWHAGEPLAMPIAFYEEAFRLTAKANTRSVRVTHSFQTNATLIDPAWCEFFRRNQAKLGVSLDGPRILHDVHRRDRNGRGTIDRTMRGVRLLQQSGTPFHVIAVLTHDSLLYADEIWDFFLDNGIRSFGFNVEQTEGANRLSSLQAGDAPPAYRAFLTRIVELWAHDPQRADIHVREIDAMIDKIACGDQVVRSAENCAASIISFDCDGNMSTFSPELLGLRDVRGDRFWFGNVATDTIENMLMNRRFLTVNAAIQAGVERCRQSCEYFPLCGGGAPWNKLAENGRFDSTQTLYCRLRIKTTADVVLEHLEREYGIV